MNNIIEKVKCFGQLWKYCYNRIDFDKFKQIMNEIGLDGESYLFEKWEQFKNDMGGFLVSHENFLIKIFEYIEKENYKG